MRNAYQPERGDFIWMDFTPHAGTEQGGRRPALVLSPRRYNVATSLAIVCPITSKVKGSAWEVVLPKGAGLGGAILANHFRSADWLARNAEYHSKAGEDLIAEVLGRIAAILLPTEG